MLHATRWGHGDPVVLVHGFTQSADAWGSVGDGLATEHEVVALDAPGHGKSAGISADLATGADLMADAAPTRAGWLGYSMGGRFCLHVALRHPERVERLVLISATAGIEDPNERQSRRRHDESLAARVETEGVEGFVRWWLAQPLFASLPPDAAAIESRLGGTAAGLASSLRLAGTGSQEPLWDALHALDMPTLVVAGGLDTKYVDLAHRLVDGIGSNASLHVLPDAGHACHLERPQEFLAVVLPFLSPA